MLTYINICIYSSDTAGQNFWNRLVPTPPRKDLWNMWPASWRWIPNDDHKWWRWLIEDDHEWWWIPNDDHEWWWIADDDHVWHNVVLFVLHRVVIFVLLLSRLVTDQWQWHQPTTTSSFAAAFTVLHSHHRTANVWGNKHRYLWHEWRGGRPWLY
jgi:hypothetical protein